MLSTFRREIFLCQSESENWVTRGSWQWCLQQLHYSFLLHWCPVITSVQDLIGNLLYFALQKVHSRSACQNNGGNSMFPVCDGWNVSNRKCYISCSCSVAVHETCHSTHMKCAISLVIHKHDVPFHTHEMCHLLSHSQAWRAIPHMKCAISLVIHIHETCHFLRNGGCAKVSLSWSHSYVYGWVSCQVF